MIRGSLFILARSSHRHLSGQCHPKGHKTKVTRGKQTVLATTEERIRKDDLRDAGDSMTHVEI